MRIFKTDHFRIAFVHQEQSHALGGTCNEPRFQYEPAFDECLDDFESSDMKKGWVTMPHPWITSAMRGQLLLSSSHLRPASVISHTPRRESFLMKPSSALRIWLACHATRLRHRL